MKTDQEANEEDQNRLDELIDKSRKTDTFAEFCACFSDCDDCPLFGGLCDADAYEKWKEEDI